ncbi:hypothetical protein SRHO_G00271420 [Serrasalmus rhombeus]
MDNSRFSAENLTPSSRVRRGMRFHSFISSITQHSFFIELILNIVIINAFVITLEEEDSNSGLFRVNMLCVCGGVSAPLCVGVFHEGRPSSSPQFSTSTKPIVDSHVLKMIQAHEVDVVPGCSSCAQTTRELAGHHSKRGGHAPWPYYSDSCPSLISCPSANPPSSSHQSEIADQPLQNGDAKKKKAAVKKEAVRAAERSSEENTENLDLSQVTATATTEISTATTETHVSTACICFHEIPMEMDDIHREIFAKAEEKFSSESLDRNSCYVNASLQCLFRAVFLYTDLQTAERLDL